MKNLLTVLFCFTLIIGKSETIELDSNMIRTFEIFKTSQLDSNCQILSEISTFPISGDNGLARLLGESDTIGVQMKKHNFEISKNLLSKNCKFLNTAETIVLSEVNYLSKNKSVKYNGCIYKGSFYIEKDKSMFQWHVGCFDLIDKAIGEYSIIFTFSLKNGKYYLSKIHGAG